MTSAWSILVWQADPEKVQTTGVFLEAGWDFVGEKQTARNTSDGFSKGRTIPDCGGKVSNDY